MKKTLAKIMVIIGLLSSTTGIQLVHAQNEQFTDATEQNINAPNFAQNSANTNSQADDSQDSQQEFFKARIMKIRNEGQQVGLDGITSYLQSYELKGLDSEDPKWKNKEITVTNSEFNTVGLEAFKPGDVLIIAHNINEEGHDMYYVVDYVRESAIYFLAFLFVALVLFIGRKKGIKALISLAVSFTVIIGLIIPQIIHGADPVFTSVAGAILITVVSLYVTYGFKYFTHIGAISMGLSLIFTVFFTVIFTEWAKLTGNVDEQATLLTQMLGTSFNVKGLLLAGFIIGAIGVLDDVVINQISLIEELHRADRSMPWQKLFQRGLKVGVDHISAIVNTLFLAYAGASLPLMILFSADQISKYNYSTIINVEVVATEIVRTLTGSLGLILAVPISTLIAAIFIPKYFHKHNNELKEKTFSPHVH